MFRLVGGLFLSSQNIDKGKYERSNIDVMNLQLNVQLNLQLK